MPKVSRDALNLDAAEALLVVRLKAARFGWSVFMRRVAQAIFLAEGAPSPVTRACVLALCPWRGAQTVRVVT
jgi:hypothetical protein